MVLSPDGEPTMSVDGVMSAVDRLDVQEALYRLSRRIERCGASLELTHAVMLCSDLRQAVSGDAYAALRVFEAIAKDREQDL
jgi:hypothetical protein